MIASNQKQQFDKQRKDAEFLKENLLFVIDFKAKIRLGYILKIRTVPKKVNTIIYESLKF
jgi:hypothetical protein